MEEKRTVRVTGKGSVKLPPDLTRLTMTLRGTEKEYADALARSARDTDALQAAFAPLGFGRDELKTLSFGVETRYESYRDDKGEYLQRFAGYEYNHVLRLEFPRDNETLGRALYILAHSGVEAEFRISYALKDAEGAKNALLASAVKDAAAKAAVLTEAAGVKLGRLRAIDYSWGDMSFEVAPVARMKNLAAPMADASYEMDVRPEDIEVSDTVTVVWDVY